MGLELTHNYPFELDNRGKRSIVLALDMPGAPALLRRLVASADIFMTNLVQPRRERFGLTPADLQAVQPGADLRVVHGLRDGGAGRGAPGLRLHGVLVAGRGSGGSWGDEGDPPAACRPGQGDHTTALNLLASTLVALRAEGADGRGADGGR